MAEDKSLYFIPILAKAFESEDPSTAFEDALSEIMRLGQLPEYQKGFTQFEQFVTSGFQSLSEDLEHFVRDRLLAMLATDTFDGPDEIRDSLVKAIKSNPDLAHRYQELLEATEKEGPPLEIELYKNDELLSALPLSADTPSAGFDKIEPGNYSLRLSNGRVIWEGRIEAKDVIWKVAFPERAYPMAAATAQDERNRTQSISHLDGEIAMTFYAGLESGHITVLLVNDSN